MDAMNDNKERTSWLAGLLRGWGIKESWAKIIAGAIMGALCAAGAFHATGCSASYARNAAGEVRYQGSIVLPDAVTEGK